jgi:hypothetical protein
MIMKNLFLIGSLAVGASFVLGLTEFAGASWAALGVGIVLGALYSWLRRTPLKVKARASYQADAESERYSEAEVEEFFRALSEAKAQSAAPFHPPHRVDVETRR